jgi:hypothetical protein
MDRQRGYTASRPRGGKGKPLSSNFTNPGRHGADLSAFEEATLSTASRLHTPGTRHMVPCPLTMSRHTTSALLIATVRRYGSLHSWKCSRNCVHAASSAHERSRPARASETSRGSPRTDLPTNGHGGRGTRRPSKTISDRRQKRADVPAAPVTLTTRRPSLIRPSGYRGDRARCRFVRLIGLLYTIRRVPVSILKRIRPRNQGRVKGRRMAECAGKWSDSIHSFRASG